MNNLTNEQCDLLGNYYASKNKFNEAKIEELLQRNKVLSDVFNYHESELKRGTETIEINEHWKVSATFRSTAKLVHESQEELEFAYIEVLNIEGEEIANSLIERTVEFNQALFNALPDEDKAMIANKCFSNKYGLNVEAYEKLEGQAKIAFSSVVEEKASLPSIQFKSTNKKGQK